MEQLSISRYLLQRLHEEGVQHIFGVPGDYILRFYEHIIDSPVQHIGTTREDTAAFCADGYARCKGLGAVAITYGVGALSVINAIAGANAETSPVVVISGAPGVQEQKDDPLLHHRSGPFGLQREIFERITCATAVLEDPALAFRQIDEVLAAAKHYSRPVYIELPRDMVDQPGFTIPAKSLFIRQTNSDTLNEAVHEVLGRFQKAESPAILAGVEVHRRSLQGDLLQLVSRSGLPVAATLTGKSVIGERHPAYLGIYEGALGAPEARQIIETADLLLMLGVTLNDIDLGINTAQLDPSRMVRACQGEVIIGHHHFSGVELADFIRTLGQVIPPHYGALPPASMGPIAEGFPAARQPMTVARMIGRLNQALGDEMIVVCDTGDCLFAASELRVHERTEFLAAAYYTSMGFAVPAALGAHVACPHSRPLVLVGDGAFQMTGTELSTMARLRQNPIIVIFNNAGYSTERFILDGPFNDIAAWRFDRLGEVMGPMQGFDVHTEDDFEAALQQALGTRHQPAILNVHLRPDDASPGMRRLGERLRAKVNAAVSEEVILVDASQPKA